MKTAWQHHNPSYTLCLNHHVYLIDLIGREEISYAGKSKVIKILPKGKLQALWFPQTLAKTLFKIFQGVTM